MSMRISSEVGRVPTQHFLGLRTSDFRGPPRHMFGRVRPCARALPRRPVLLLRYDRPWTRRVSNEPTLPNPKPDAVPTAPPTAVTTDACNTWMTKQEQVRLALERNTELLDRLQFPVYVLAGSAAGAVIGHVACIVLDRILH